MKRQVKTFLDYWPGKKSIGIYRFLPIFFFMGAALEYSMINWTVGETNFCKLNRILRDGISICMNVT